MLNNKTWHTLNTAPGFSEMIRKTGPLSNYFGECPPNPYRQSPPCPALRQVAGQGILQTMPTTDPSSHTVGKDPELVLQETTLSCLCSQFEYLGEDADHH
jgi:hypothetical protein